MGRNSGITPRSAMRLSTGEVVPAIIREAADVVYVAPNSGINVGGMVEGRGGDFKNLTQAIAHARAAGCSASRPFVIKASPAFYQETLNIVGGENDDLGIVIQGDPFAVIGSNSLHLFQGFRPGFVGFENVLFRGALASPLFQLTIDRVGMSQSTLANYMRHVRFENTMGDGGGNFAYLSARDVQLEDVTALSKVSLLNNGRNEISNSDLAGLLCAYNPTIAPTPLDGPRGTMWRESSLWFNGQNSFIGAGPHTFRTCDLCNLGLGPDNQTPPVDPVVYAENCAFWSALDLLGASILQVAGCHIDCVPTVAVTGAVIGYSQGAASGQGTYNPPVTLAAVAVPAAGDFFGQLVFVTDDRSAWKDCQGVNCPATAGLIYWDGAAWIAF